MLTLSDAYNKTLHGLSAQSGRLKDNIPPEIGFALGTNANEIYTKNMKYTWPTPAFCVGTQRQLYSTDWRRGLASGLTQILGLALGVWRRETQIFTF